MTQRPTIRVIQDGALDGPTNMARDEALMNRVGRAASPPTVRLYQWAPPTVSLGYFQRYAAFQALPPPARDLAVVRRLTGGGAILHDLELTYSMALPVDHTLLDGGPNRLYELAHDAIIAALAALDIRAARCGLTDDSTPARGPFFCFARRHCYDVVIDGAKVAGSAQRRTRDAVLQHGSMIVARRYDQQETAQLGRAIEETIGHLRHAFVRELASVCGLVFEVAEWAPDELSDAAALIAKYAGPAWTRRT